MILGIDEVGRGAWAGPMVVGAAVLGDAKIEGLTDSKKLTKKARERLAIEIRQKAAGVGLGWVSAKTIDSIGLSAALKLAARRAIADIGCDYDEVIIDGTIRLIEGPNVTMLKKADLLIPTVSAAAIVAKVARDEYMAHLDEVFVGYGFAGHVGYGTAAHMAALQKNGVLPLHRASFAPVKALLNGTPSPSEDAKIIGTSKAVGNAAEDQAARYLETHGHTIVARNWHTKACEIDIVSEPVGTLYFTEVKYRRQDGQGGGIAAITPSKLKQMRFASEVFVQVNRLDRERRLTLQTYYRKPPLVDTYLDSVE
jgi:ribonuclease HII